MKLLTKSTFSVAEVFNYSRPVNMENVIKKHFVNVIPKNESFPWTTDDQALGFHASIALLTWYHYDVYSHPKEVFDGAYFQFHSPFEYPSEVNPQYFVRQQHSSMFLVEPEITELGDTLKDYEIEKLAS